MENTALSAGLLVPSNNTTMEPELLAWLPEGSSCRTVRIPRGKGALTASDLPDYIAQAVALAKGLADEDLDLVVYGCTAAGFIAGPARDAEVAAQLARVSRKRVVTTASSMNAVLRHLEARRIALITPYLDEVNERLQAFVGEAGIGVGVLSTFRARTVEELAAITSQEIVERAREVVLVETQLPVHETKLMSIGKGYVLF